MNLIHRTAGGLKIITVCLLLILILGGCEKGTLGVKGGSVSGYILDSRTLAGVSGVSITAETGAGDSKVNKITYSDSNGGYYFSDLRAGEWVMSFDKVGYQPVYTDATYTVKVVVVNNEHRVAPEIRMVQNYVNQYVTIKGILKDAKNGTLINLGVAQFVFENQVFNNRVPSEFQTGFSVPAVNGGMNVSIKVTNYETYTTVINNAVTDRDLGVIMLQPMSYKVVGVWKDVPGWVFQEAPTANIFAYSGNRVVATTSCTMSQQSFELTGIPIGTSVTIDAQIKGFRMNGPVPVTPNSDFQGIIYQNLSLKSNFSQILRDVRLVVNGNNIGLNERIGGYCNETGTVWPQTIVTGGILSSPRVVDLGVNQVPTGYTLTFTGFNVDDGTIGTSRVIINDDGVDPQIVTVQVN
ncbi:MAG: carboxypeptidase regulatory-like domain-containing protein [Candidatus Riflebacteria bacterium]|nr:carboxypeptidase regulatory-like domain-containing protein [Candidatus Riflebacteria bacterium]